MNKTLCKIISAAILGVSLGVLGTSVTPSYSVSASIIVKYRIYFIVLGVILCLNYLIPSPIVNVFTYKA